MNKSSTMTADTWLRTPQPPGAPAYLRKRTRTHLHLWWERHNGAWILWLYSAQDARLRLLGGIPGGDSAFVWVACPKRLRARIARVALGTPRRIPDQYYRRAQRGLATSEEA